ncbi:MAG: DegV family protein [Bacillota bacterium]|nr:DegV family protein [Bacillota bacterium]
MAIRIVTDSTAYISPEVLERYSIEVVPLSVHFGDEVFKEGEKYTNKEYYDKLRNTKLSATTSQPSSGEFLSVYEKLAEEGHEIVSIHISSILSGTYASAQTASSLLPNAKITIIDSLTTACPLSWMVTEAAKAAEEGKTSEDIIQLVETIKENNKIMFVVDTLEYLKRGGRIGGAQALLGTILQIKPILHLSNGRIEVLDKVRTKQKALSRLTNELEIFLSAQNDYTNIKVAVLAVDDDTARLALKESLLVKYPSLEIESSELGPVIGSHVGPGTVGISFTKFA